MSTSPSFAWFTDGSVVESFKYGGVVNARGHTPSSPLVSLLRPQKLLIIPLCMGSIPGPPPGCFPTRAFFLKNFLFFTHPYKINRPSIDNQILLFSNERPKLGFPGELTAIGSACQLSDLWAWRAGDGAGLRFSNECVMTCLYLDSDNKPAGCRRCILGSCTLVFVWER